MKKQQEYIVLGILVFTVGALSFFGGMKYQQSKSGTRSFPQFSRNGQGFDGQMRIRNGSGPSGAGGRQVTGEILSQDDKSITVKMPDGSSRIVLVTNKTTYNKATEGTKNDLKVGGMVRVFGIDNTDGSVTALSIQLNLINGMATESGKSQ